MSKIILPLFSLVFFITGCLNIIQSQWVQVNSVLRGRVVLSYASNDKYNFAGTQDEGIYRTLKGTEDWVCITENTVLDNLTINAIAVKDNYIYAGSLASGLYFSDNNGTNWSVSNLNNQKIYALFVNSNYVFAGLAQDKGVYRTNTGEKHFIAVNTGLTSKTIFSLAANKKYLFAGTGSKGVFYSTNNGDNWDSTVISNNQLAVFSLIAYQNHVYAGTEKNGLYYSQDTGKTWNKSSFNENKTIYTLTLNNCYLFAGLYQVGVCVLNKQGELIGDDYYDDPHGSTVRTLWIVKDYLYAGTLRGVLKRKLSGPYSN
ncbi:MAG: hypothetical protein J0M18_19395 [Ignavibacteria bacterium]|nr:hypothetical protein [Ignavibacteria bacterium]